MKKIIIVLMVASLSMGFSGCTGTQILEGIEGVLGGGSGDNPVTENEIIQGLKQALEIGVSKGAATVSKEDGFFGNSLIKIPFPPEAQKVEDKLRNIPGMDKAMDKFVLSLNRGAELAAKSAKSIFIGAIRQMTITDAMNILKGEPNAATNFLKRATTAQLTKSFTPVVDKSLNQVKATKYWDDVVTPYNKLPFTQKVNPDLTGFVTERAIDGLFLMVEKEEAKIRKDPLKRTTEILKRVFKLQD